MKKLLLAAAALALAAPPLAAQDEAEPPTPGSVVAASLPEEWVAIDPADLLVMTLAPDADGNPREVVIQLMPAPFSQGWVENIKTLAKAHWWDGLSIYRSVDNWVVQWGDGEEDEADRARPTKPLPEGLNVVPESEYVSDSGVVLRDNSASFDPKFFPLLSPDPYLGISDPDKRIAWAGGLSGMSNGWPVAFLPTAKLPKVEDMGSISNSSQDGKVWPTHCYGSVGVARDLSPDTGTGAELYAVIGHAPRQLDRNIAVVGRVIEGMAHLSILPRGTGEYGVYKTEAEHTPIMSVRLGNETGDFPPPNFEYLDTGSESFARYADVSANRNDAFYKVAAGGIDICNLKVPIRRVPSD